MDSHEAVLYDGRSLEASDAVGSAGWGRVWRRPVLTIRAADVSPSPALTAVKRAPDVPFMGRQLSRARVQPDDHTPLRSVPSLPVKRHTVHSTGIRR